MCDTSAFIPSVPNLRVLLQSVHCASNSLSSMAFKPTEIWMFKPTLVKYTLSHSCSRFRSQSLSGTGEACVDKFHQAVGKMPLTFLHTSERSTTNGADCESHQHISPKQRKKEIKKAMTEAVNDCTYLRPN